MVRKLTPQSTLENLKREAKQWLKALRAKDAEARARFERAHHNPPVEPGLRDVQHALAREHGADGWTALQHQLSVGAQNLKSHGELVGRFLHNACPDHHVRGGPAHVMALHTAGRMLEQHPEIARDSIYTAVVCGELGEVKRILKERPGAATEKSTGVGDDRGRSGGSEDLFKDVGPMRWEPLLYLCFTRLPNPAINDNAVSIARLLLDHGANPNAYFMAGDSLYTPLVGVIGEGEENRPPHPRRDALAKLLIERGANPYDMQVIYNTHFNGDVRWYLEMAYANAVAKGRTRDWEDPNWPMFDMGGYGCGARFLLGLAIDRDDLELAEWMLQHGASANAPPAPRRSVFTSSASARLSPLTLYEEAVTKGFMEMADLLARFGAERVQPTLDGPAAFAAACLRLDRRGAESLLAEHPEYLRFPQPMAIAAKGDRTDVIALLLDLGVSADVEDPERGNERPLHAAAYNDSLRAAKLLLERGAQPDPRETIYGITPLWGAIWGRRQRMIEFLSPISRDVWSHAFIGNVERLREVLRTEPGLARSRGENETPLMWLPADETRALEVASLFLDLGADPTVRNKQGLTAADLAARRSLDQVAELLRDAERAH